MLGRQTDVQLNEYIRVNQGSPKTGCRQMSPGNSFANERQAREEGWLLQVSNVGSMGSV